MFELDSGTQIATCTGEYFDKFMDFVDEKVIKAGAPGIAFFIKEFGRDLVMSAAAAKEKRSSRGGGSGRRGGRGGGGGSSYRGRDD